VEDQPSGVSLLDVDAVIPAKGTDRLGDVKLSPFFMLQILKLHTELLFIFV
jgi:hypothetical protein